MMTTPDPVRVVRGADEELARALGGIPEEWWWGTRRLLAKSAIAHASTASVAWPPFGGGVYVFARHGAVGLADVLGGGPPGCTALYIGQTGDFALRLRPSRHGEWQRAADLGMTHVHVLSMPGASEDDRRDEERELRERYRPTLNPPPRRLPDWRDFAEFMGREQARPSRRAFCRDAAMITLAAIPAADTVMDWLAPKDSLQPRAVSVNLRRRHDVGGGLRPLPLRVAVALRPPRIAATLEGAPGSVSVVLTKSSTA